MENTKIVKLFLDDERDPEDCRPYMVKRIQQRAAVYTFKDWIIVRSYGDFVDYIENNTLPKLVSLDHDLGDNFALKTDLDIEKYFNSRSNREYTGYDCLLFLIQYYKDKELPLPIVFCHSQNPVGYERINSTYLRYKDEK